HFGVFVFAGVVILGLVASDLRRRRDVAAAMLAVWVGGVMVFASFLNWTTNVRSVLPAVPAAALLLARAADERFGVAPLPAAARRRHDDVRAARRRILLFHLGTAPVPPRPSAARALPRRGRGGEVRTAGRGRPLATAVLVAASTLFALLLTEGLLRFVRPDVR